MAAPKGNEFALGLTNNGRPPEYKNVEDMEAGQVNDSVSVSPLLVLVDDFFCIHFVALSVYQTFNGHFDVLSFEEVIVSFLEKTFFLNLFP